MTGPAAKEVAGKVPCGRADVAVRFLDDETVLLDERTGTLFRLNSSATLVWRGIDGQRTVQAIVDGLASEVAMDAGVLREDVIAVVRHLASHGLVELSPDGVSSGAPQHADGGRQRPDTSAK